MNLRLTIFCPGSAVFRTNDFRKCYQTFIPVKFHSKCHNVKSWCNQLPSPGGWPSCSQNRSLLNVFSGHMQCGYNKSIGNYSPSGNHYDILGLNQLATREQIKEAFLELSKQYHPDKMRSELDESDIDVFLKVRKAYEVLHNQNRRAEYDMKIFGRSSHINRFSSGEYILHQKNAEISKKESSRDDGNKESNINDNKDDSSNSDDGNSLITAGLKALLSKLYAAIFLCGIAIYFLGKYTRKSKEEKTK